MSDLDGLIAGLGSAGGKLRAQGSRIVRKAGSDAAAIAQGKAPVDTGFHRASIGMDVLGELTVAYGCTTHYGPYLEDGTYKMAPRPHIRPAADAVLPSMTQALGVAAERALL